VLHWFSVEGHVKSVHDRHRVEGGEVIDVAAFQGHVRRARVPGVLDQFVLVEQSKVVEGLADFNTDSRLYVHGEVETGETAAAAQVY